LLLVRPKVPPPTWATLDSTKLNLTPFPHMSCCFGWVWSALDPGESDPAGILGDDGFVNRMLAKNDDFADLNIPHAQRRRWTSSSEVERKRATRNERIDATRVTGELGYDKNCSPQRCLSRCWEESFDR
jgi:hypothetical protein